MRSTQYRLLLLFGFMAVLAYGVIAYRLDLPPFRLGSVLSTSAEYPEGSPPTRRGRWGAAPDSLSRSLTPEQRDRMERLQSVGYLSGREPPPARAGVTRYEADSVYAGDNLAVSGHAPEAWVFDMSGRRLHAWSCAYREAFPDAEVPGGTETPYYWRRAYAYPNGDLLAIFDGLGLVKLDRNSRILWALSRGVHHDLQVQADGTIFTLIREAKVIPRIHPTEPVLEDFVAALDPQGRVLRSISLLEALEASDHRDLLARMPGSGDLFHTNTLEIFDGAMTVRSPLYRRGNALVSFLTLDAIAIVDLGGRDVAWAATGIWRAQHEPTLLADGRILLFDNRGRDGASRVLEFDPGTGKIPWMYGDTDSTAFATDDCGSVSRLPNGNTLITESNRGRAFEITRSGRTVWEYTSPFRAGERKEMIATLFEVVRIPAGYWTPEFEASLRGSAR